MERRFAVMESAKARDKIIYRTRTRRDARRIATQLNKDAVRRQGKKGPLYFAVALYQ